MTQLLKYSLADIEKIIFDGFDFNLPTETVNIINDLSSHVGSPTYIKTPNFKKKQDTQEPRRNVFSKTDNINEKWETITKIHPAKPEQKDVVHEKIDALRSAMNKLTDKNYIDYRNKIVDILDELVKNSILDKDMLVICSIIFEIASNNRFYSKIYADLYSDLIHKYSIIKTIFEESLISFMSLFDIVEYVDSTVDYDRFCKNNKDNERRKSLSLFFLNLMKNGIISNTQIINLVKTLITQVHMFISSETKKNEVDELSENVCILFSAELFANDTSTINGMTVYELITHLAKSKPKTYPGLSSKTMFKYMDLLGL
jgi:hypothetical protein